MRAAAISLIISAHEQAPTLERVLAGVHGQVESPREVLIADDGSGPATREVIASWQKKLSVPLRQVWQPHDGFRKTLILNQAMAAASGDYIVFLDGDCVPHARFVADHAAQAEKGFWVQGRRCFVAEKFVPEFSLATPVWLWLLTGRISGAAKALRFPWPVVRRDRGQRGILGCNLGVWRDDLLAINGFDEAYTGWGAEDSDLGTRLYNLGRPRKFLYGRAIVFHLNHPVIARTYNDAARVRLAETIRSGRIRCERGVGQYLRQERV